jgi:hypothetical protein
MGCQGVRRRGSRAWSSEIRLVSLWQRFDMQELTDGSCLRLYRKADDDVGFRDAMIALSSADLLPW